MDTPDTSPATLKGSGVPSGQTPEELRRAYAGHLRRFAGALASLEAEKLAAWTETALDWLEADPPRAELSGAEARYRAALVLEHAGIPTPEPEPEILRRAKS